MGLQYGIKEVLDLNILNYANKKPIAYVDYALTSTNENSGERTFLDGGQGMARLMSFDSQKTSTFSLTLPLVDLNLVAMLAGEDLINDTTSEIFKREVLTVTDNAGTSEVSLAVEPINTPSVFKLEGLRDYGEEITGATVSGQTLDLTSGAVTAGEQVVVLYQHAAPAGAKEIKVKANKFPPAVEMHGIGLGRNQEDEQDYPVHVKIHKAKAQPNFTFTLSGTEATNLELTFDLFAVQDANGDGQYIDYIFETA
jgi:hypothetical protein